MNFLKFQLTMLIAVCDGRACNHGSCEPTGADGFACVCEEGWHGINCDKEYALGGWIAGITVLAVLCLALFAVTFIFARRFV